MHLKFELSANKLLRMFWLLFSSTSSYVFDVEGRKTHLMFLIKGCHFHAYILGYVLFLNENAQIIITKNILVGKS